MISCKINFNSKKGLIFYGVLMILLYILWMICILWANFAVFSVAQIIIPVSFFLFGKQYLKQKEDKKHLKIHKTLLLMFGISILLFLIIIFCFTLIGKSAIILGTVLMLFIFIISCSLYLNALGGSKILDFVMGIFINYSES